MTQEVRISFPACPQFQGMSMPCHNTRSICDYAAGCIWRGVWSQSSAYFVLLPPPCTGGWEGMGMQQLFRDCCLCTQEAVVWHNLHPFYSVGQATVWPFNSKLLLKSRPLGGEILRSLQCVYVSLCPVLCEIHNSSLFPCCSTTLGGSYISFNFFTHIQGEIFRVVQEISAISITNNRQPPITFKLLGHIAKFTKLKE